jgi:HSP20 family molecular chaperone IbpA
VPSEWALFDFNIIPFSPVYSTEVAIPDSAYVKILITKDKDDGNSKVINDHLIWRNTKMRPRIYMINWSRIKDNTMLPVPNGYYTLRFSAFSDSLHTDLLFQSETKPLFLLNWEVFDKFAGSDLMVSHPNYYVATSASEIRKRDEPRYQGVQYEIAGIRVKKAIDLEITGHMLSLSIRFTNETDTRRIVSFYPAKQQGKNLTDIILGRRLTAYERGEYASVGINNHRSADYLVIHHLGSDLVLIDLQPIWTELNQSK